MYVCCIYHIYYNVHSLRDIPSKLAPDTMCSAVHMTIYYYCLFLAVLFEFDCHQTPRVKHLIERLRRKRDKCNFFFFLSHSETWQKNNPIPIIFKTLCFVSVSVAAPVSPVVSQKYRLFPRASVNTHRLNARTRVISRRLPPQGLRLNEHIDFTIPYRGTSRGVKTAVKKYHWATLCLWYLKTYHHHVRQPLSSKIMYMEFTPYESIFALDDGAHQFAQTLVEHILPTIPPTITMQLLPKTIKQYKKQNHQANFLSGSTNLFDPQNMLYKKYYFRHIIIITFT